MHWQPTTPVVSSFSVTLTTIVLLMPWANVTIYLFVLHFLEIWVVGRLTAHGHRKYRLPLDPLSPGHTSTQE